MQYLAKHGGYANAYTSTDNTNYYFDVNADALLGALERFSCFFHSPIFSSTSTLRELDAIESEHRKNLQSDSWRIGQLKKHLSCSGHPFTKFGTGDKQTLTEAARKMEQSTTTSETHEEKLLSDYTNAGTNPAPSDVSISNASDADGGLIGRRVRRQVIDWWEKEYCASRMSLAIIGKGNIVTLI